MGGKMCLVFIAKLLFLIPNFTLISHACPYPCSCSNSRVDCYGKGLKEIPQDIPFDVVYIDLQTNEIESVGDQLQNLTMLQEVMLRFNRISHLSDGAFSNMPSLKHVNLGTNLITNLSRDVFQNVPKMKILDLADNQLTAVDGSFDNLVSLTKLVLTRNRIEQLAQSALKPLTSLVYLMADENQISHISPTAFHSLKELSYMSLAKNPLGSMDNVLSKNILLSYLDLGQCQLQTVPAGLPWATRYIQLSRNNITKIFKDTFLQTRFLGIIILDENAMTEIEPGAFMPIAHLQQIWLNGNRLTSFPSPIPSSVNTVCIEGNEITKLTNVDFPENSKMKLLSLKGNKIGQIGLFAFSHLSSLQKLYLSGNAITNLKDKLFSGLRNLTALEVGRNPITHIDTRFAAGLHRLEILDMSYVEDTEPFVKGNFFRDVPFLKSLNLRYSPSLARHILSSEETLKSFYNLDKLDLRDNHLQSLETDLPRFFPNLKSVQLARNAWICDSKLLWLHDWMHRAGEVFVDAEEVVCAMPMHLAGAAIADLPLSAFYYTTTTTTTTTTTMATTKTDLTELWEITTESSGEVGSGSIAESTTSVFNTDESSTPKLASYSTASGLESEITVLDFATSPSAADADFSDTVSTISRASTSRPTKRRIQSTMGVTPTVQPTSTSTESSSPRSVKTGSTPTAQQPSTESHRTPFSSTAAVRQDTTTDVSASSTTMSSSIGLTSPTSLASSTSGAKPSAPITTEKDTTTTTANYKTAKTRKSEKTVTSTIVSTTTQTTTIPSTTTIATRFSTTTEDGGMNDTGDRSSEDKDHTPSNQNPATSTTTTTKSTSSILSAVTTPTTASAATSTTSSWKTTTTLSELTHTSSSPTTASTTMSNDIPVVHPTSDSDTTVTTDIPNNIPRFGGSQNRMPSVADASATTKTIIIATSVTIIALIVILVAAAFIRRHRKQIQLVYYRAFSYTVETNDTAFVLSDQDEPDTRSDSGHRTPRSGSERGSTGSRPSVEDANNPDQSMDMIIWKEC